MILVMILAKANPGMMSRPNEYITTVALNLLSLYTNVILITVSLLNDLNLSYAAC